MILLATKFLNPPLDTFVVWYHQHKCGLLWRHCVSILLGLQLLIPFYFALWWDMCVQLVQLQMNDLLPSCLNSSLLMLFLFSQSRYVLFTKTWVNFASIVRCRKVFVKYVVFGVYLWYLYLAWVSQHFRCHICHYHCFMVWSQQHYRWWTYLCGLCLWILKCCML